MLGAIAVIVIIAIINAVVGIREKKWLDEIRAISISKLYFTIGLAGMIFFCSLIWYMNSSTNDTDEWWVYVIFFSFSIISLACVCGYFNWYIILNSNSFTYRTIFRRKYQCKYKDVRLSHNFMSFQVVHVMRKFFFVPLDTPAVSTFFYKIRK